MTITLTIDSLDRLPDGGPVQYQARNRGFEIGRQHHLDWTLPDPSRYISGLHCDVRFEKGGYWLYDVSSNGTFLNGSTSRMKSPHLLADGDRLSIGHYTIGVRIEDASAPSRAAPNFRVEAPQAEPVYGAPSDDIWDTGSPAPPPIDRRELIPEPAGRRRAADFSDQFIDLPDMQPAAAVPTPRPAVADPFAMPEGGAVPYRSEPAPAPSLPPVDPFASEDPSSFAYRSEPPPAPRAGPADPFASSDASDFAYRADPLPPPRAAPPPPPAPVSVPYRPAPAEAPVSRGRALPVDSGESFAPQLAEVASALGAQAPGSQSGSRAQASQRFLEGLAAGAGVSPEIFASRDPAEIGFEVGEFLKVTIEQLAQLLRARAAAKAMTKSSSRTMIGATDNNPLKFIPVPAEIIEVMFTRKRPGYLGARPALEAGFGDLKRHELATWTAMQKALSRLLDDFSPETISAKAGNSVLSSKKSRSWEIFVERWEAKTEPHENGMLDVFLGYFAEAYDEANRKG